MEHASELLHQICWALVQLLAGTEKWTPSWLPVEMRKPFLAFLLYPVASAISLLCQPVYILQGCSFD